MKEQTSLLLNIHRDHVAIMNSDWKLTTKILSGEKTIETRWYKNRISPWNRVQSGDVVYFKDRGKPVTIQARVAKVEQYANLTQAKVKKLIERFAVSDGIGINENQKDMYTSMFKDKHYCIVIYLKNARAIIPFQVEKKGYGNQCAWMVVDSIDKIKIPIDK